MSEKKFAIVFFCVIEGFFLLNVLFWHVAVRPTFYDKDGHGDLARLGSYRCSYSMTKIPHYAKTHINFTDYLRMEDKPKIDIVTIGDSYSNGAAGSWYQDYLADRYGKSVLHINIAGYEPAELLIMIEQSGWMQEMAPKVVILESVERKMQDRYGRRDIKAPEISKEKIIQKYVPKNIGTHQQENQQNLSKQNQLQSVMLEANKRYIHNKLKYANNSKQVSDDVNVETLECPLFTNQNQENILLFYHDEFWYKEETPDYVTINQVINDLSDRCKRHNIKLVFMTCVDKFDLYYPYIKDKNDSAENPFFEEFEKYPKQYIFINTKKILRTMLDEGEQDVYWMDDTHWSWKGQQRVVDYLMNELSAVL